jgi:hypothetical protein
MNHKKMNVEVLDKSGERASESINIDIESYGSDIEIQPDGYTGIHGSGCPVLIELWNDELRVVVWGDVNQEDPTHIISLEGAKESNRKQDT